MYDGVYELEPIEPRRDHNLKQEATSPGGNLEEHPMWVRLRTAMMMALQPFAEAREAVVLALDQAFAVNST